MDRNCDAFIRSNNTYDILIARESLEISDDRAECIQNIGEKFVAEYFDRDEVPQLSIKTYGYSIIPKCFGLLDTLALETTGILQLQNQPALSLRGQGIFIGFVDTGISYELPCFRNADGSTRIRSIWDQSIPAGEKNTPQGFLYGTEYTQKEINEALEQEHPRELVPVTDEDGHGTMLASIACGSEDLQAGFTGAAPYAELLVVKLKPAKPYLKENAQIIDPFCGVGTMLIERDIRVPAREKYGTDIFGEAIDGARENAALAGEQINFIHRDFFDFRHDYLFDEIVTNMPVRGKMTREQLDRLYEKFFRKALTILEKEAVIVMYTGEIGFVKKQLRLHREFSLLEEYCMQSKTGCYLFIIGVKR